MNKKIIKLNLAYEVNNKKKKTHRQKSELNKQISLRFLSTFLDGVFDGLFLLICPVIYILIRAYSPVFAKQKEFLLSIVYM